jgi:autotransporter passenger strand-loop-strand repeat protein
MTTITISSGTTVVSTHIATTTAYIVQGSGTLEVASAGVVSALTTVRNAGVVSVDLSGTVLGTLISAGGTEIDSGTAVNTTISSGGTQSVSRLASVTTINSHGLQQVGSGGTAIVTTINSGGKQDLVGGKSIATAIKSGGTEIVEATAIASGTTVSQGGLLSVSSGGTATNPITAVGGAVNVADGGTVVLSAAPISNFGAINLLGRSGGAGATVLIDGSVILGGAGKVTLSGANNFIGAGAAGATLNNLNDVIAGAGQIGAGDNNLTLINSGIIDANDGHAALTIATGANAITNAKLLEATGSGELLINTSLTAPYTGSQFGYTIEQSDTGVLKNAGTAEASGGSAFLGIGNLANSGVVEAIQAATSSFPVPPPTPRPSRRCRAALPRAARKWTSLVRSPIPARWSLPATGAPRSSR